MALMLSGCGNILGEPPMGGELSVDEDVIIEKTVREQLTDKSSKEKASFKGKEIAKIKKVAKVKRTKYDIEIVDMKEIDGGVEVFARAWDKDGQIGFGKDGTIDIERFIIHNPPILVPDENGDIIREWIDIDTGEKKIRKLREDLKEAILQSLEHTISVKKQVFDDSKIVSGKIGNTTSTFYPAAGANSPVDGFVERSVTNESFSTIRTSAGTGASPTYLDLQPSKLISGSSSNTFNNLARGIVLFNTSSIAVGDTVSSATLSLYVTAKSNTAGESSANAGLRLTTSTPANDNNLVNADYANLGTTAIASDIPYDSVTTSAYNNFSLTDLTKISQTANSKFGLRSKVDADNGTPAWSSGNRFSIKASSADVSGTIQDPKLVVEHSVGGNSNFLPFF